MPTRNLEPDVCAVCGNKLLVQENEEGIIENTYKLTCGHVYVLYLKLNLIFLNTFISGSTNFASEAGV